MECVTVHLTSRPSRFTEHLLENYASMHNLHFPRLLSEGLTRFPLDSRNFSSWGSLSWKHRSTKVLTNLYNDLGTFHIISMKSQC
jgi:hypothetical protein